MKPAWLAIALLLTFTGFSSRAEASRHLSIEELRQLRLPDVVLDSVTTVAPGARKKSGVQVKGVVGEHIRFELLLPDEWNGRFVMGGGGGFVGARRQEAVE